MKLFSNHSNHCWLSAGNTSATLVAGVDSRILRVPSPLDSFWRSSPVDVSLFLQGFLCNFVRKSPQNVEKNSRFTGKNNGRVFIQSCTETKKIRVSPRTILKNFSALDTQTAVLISTAEVWIPKHQFVLVFWVYTADFCFFSAGRETFSDIFVRCLSRKVGSQHQLRIKTLPSLVVKRWKFFLSPTLWRGPPLICVNLRENLAPGILQSECCANFSSWRCESQCEFLSEFRCEFLRSAVAFLGRFK